MTSYSVLLTTEFRADCKGNGIAHAMKNLAKDRPEVIPLMTSTFITYKNGFASIHDWRTTKASITALTSIKHKATA